MFRVDVEHCARCGGPMRWVATDEQGHVTLTLGPPLFDEEGFTLPTISVARIADQPSSHHQHALRSARDLRTPTELQQAERLRRGAHGLR